MGARGKLIAAGLGLFIALAGGAAFVTVIIHLPRTCEGPSPQWDNPYASAGIEVADVNEAAPYLAFTPLVPRALGPATKLFVGGNKPDMSAKSLIWVYEPPVSGPFWVTESISEITQASINSMTNNPTGCSKESVVMLQRGIRAAVLVGGTTSIMWLDHGLLIDVLGSGFTKEHAIELANQV